MEKENELRRQAEEEDELRRQAEEEIEKLREEHEKLAEEVYSNSCAELPCLISRNAVSRPKLKTTIDKELLIEFIKRKKSERQRKRILHFLQLV